MEDLSKSLTVKIQCQGQAVVEFKREIANLCEYIKNIPDLSKEIVMENIEESTLQFIKIFCEKHDYQQSSMKWKFPFESNQLDAHLDGKSADVFKDFNFTSDSQDRLKQIKEHSKKIAPIIQASYSLGFEKLKKISNVVLQIPFYCGPTEDEIAKFKEKWDISNQDISAEKQKEIMDKYTPVFDSLQLAYQQKLQELQKHAEVNNQ